jgi:glycosyltransferase involved in cell wall biosynthesis
MVRPRALTREPSVSVVVPCYNYGHYLADLVDRLLSQSGVQVDIVVIDDCSPDGSGQVAADLARSDPRVRAILHENNLGHIATYNEGLAQVSGDYVVLLSADDLLPPGALGRATALMEAYPRVGLVYGFSQSFSGAVPDEPHARLRNWSVWSGEGWLTRLCTTGRNVISSPEVVMRSAAMREMVGYDPSMPHAADLDLWLRTALRWDVGRVNGPTQAWYRVHDSNMHLTTYAGMITDLVERRRLFTLFYDERATDRADIQPLRGQTMRALARTALRLGFEANLTAAAPAELAEFAAFACETWPDIKRSRQWRSYEAGPGSGARPTHLAARKFAAKVRAHLWWRRWRRYGI